MLGQKLCGPQGGKVSVLARVAKCVVTKPLLHLGKGVASKLLMGVISPDASQGIKHLAISLHVSSYLRERGSGSRRYSVRGRILLLYSVDIRL